MLAVMLLATRWCIIVLSWLSLQKSCADVSLRIYSLAHIADQDQAGVLMLCWFLPARRYANAGNSDRNVSVRHARVLCQNEES